jgi:hypothetical protein
VFDEILISAELKRLVFKFSDLGQISLICTHIESDEIDSIPFEKLNKWAEINILKHQLKARKVPVSGVMLDISKLGESKFISHNEMKILETSINGNSDFVNDSALALTAKENQATLVTNDIKLLKKAVSIIGAKAINCQAFGATLRNLER